MKNIRQVLEDLLAGSTSLEEAENLLKKQTLAHIDTLAQFDLERHKRSGIPEVIYAEHKTPEECLKIVKGVIDKQNKVLLTRVTPAHIQTLLILENDGLVVQGEEIARCVIVKKADLGHSVMPGPKVAIFAAGTSDRPVAEEARVTAEFLECQVLSFIDVGVAGIHRLVTPLKQVMSENVAAIIACAGMEASLPGVIASMVPVPVIGVPTSVGHGVSYGGFVALLSILSSCSPGLAVVNIDSGFNAGAMAALIALNSAGIQKSEDLE